MIVSLLISLPVILGLAAYASSFLSRRAPRIIGTVGSGLVLLLSLYAFALSWSHAGIVLEERLEWIPGIISYHVGLDGLSAPLILLTAALTFLAAMSSYIEIGSHEGEYYSLLLLFEASGIGVFAALNIILFYFFWEVTLIPMFFFIGIWGGPRRRYAAMKFLLYTFTGSLIMLLAFLGIYVLGPVKSFDFLRLLAHKGQLPLWLQIWASIGMLVGFGVKLPMFPFHTWLPDAHVEAPSPISVILAGVLLKMGGYGFIRFNLQLLTQAAIQMAWVYIGFGIVTMFYGAIVAFMQDDFKRMVALTSINHMGYVLLGAFAGLAAAALKVHSTYALEYGVGGAIFQMFNHGFAIGLMFIMAGVLKHYVGSRNISQVRGLRFLTPRTAALLIMGAFAAMGVPLYSSFLSEFMVILAAISFNSLLWIAVFVPGITAGYYLWTVRRMVFTEPMSGVKVIDIRSWEFAALLLFLIPLIVLLFVPGLVMNPISSYVASLGVG